MFRFADPRGHQRGHRAAVLSLGVAALVLTMPMSAQGAPVGGSAPVLNINTRTVEIYGGTAELDGSTTVEKTSTGSRSRVDCTVLFAKDSDRLRSGAKEKLDRLARQLRAQGPGKLRITGYTDDLGPAAHGLDLSRRRATRVAEELRHRLPAKAYPMDVRGRGEADPAVPNTSEANRRKNRRVVVTLTLTPSTPRAQTRSRPTTSPTPTPTPMPTPSTTPSRATSTPAAPTATTSAAAPPPPPPPPVPPRPSPAEGGPTPWPLIAGAGLVLIAGGAAADLAVRRHRRHSPPATGRVEATPAPAGPTTPPDKDEKGGPGDGGHSGSKTPPSGSPPTPAATADLVWSRPETTIVYGQARTRPPAEFSTPEGPAGHVMAPTPGLTPADPQLDRDVEAWLRASTTQPRLTLLGPVRARTTGQAIARRKPYYTELLAYLTLRRNGATADEIAATFNLTTPRVRTDMKILRDWLGPNPATGRPHLPDARDSPAAHQRGIAVYQVEDVLCDWQLFVRLRDRAACTTGQSRINDLEQALHLVQGRPFDHLRANGWNWALTTDRLDQEATMAIVATAHTAFAYHQDRHNAAAARRAAQTAATAAPHEDGPRHDLEALAAVAGRSS